jgi:two-component system sensor histidine kinase CpxA
LAAEILERTAKPAAQKYIDDLKDDIGMMSRLTDELLQFAKAESPEPVKLEPTSVAEAIRRAVRHESVEGAEIRIDAAPHLMAQCNMEYLVRSLANVLRNAVRYAGDCGRIDVSAGREDNAIVITVADRGPGVPADALERIFTPFYRLDDARDRRTGGSGLGLAIVRTCIEACGGSVECMNRQPSGLVVVLRLPAP